MVNTMLPLLCCGLLWRTYKASDWSEEGVAPSCSSSFPSSVPPCCLPGGSLSRQGLMALLVPPGCQTLLLKPRSETLPCLFWACPGLAAVAASCEWLFSTKVSCPCKSSVGPVHQASYSSFLSIHWNIFSSLSLLRPVQNIVQLHSNKATSFPASSQNLESTEDRIPRRHVLDL